MTLLVLAAALYAALYAAPCADTGGKAEADCLMRAASALESEAEAREKALAAGKARAEAAQSAALDTLYDGAERRPPFDVELKDAPAQTPSLSPRRLPNLTLAVFAAPRAVEPMLGDLDGDGISEASEKELAQGLMPELEWAQDEPCGENRTLYQFHPLSPTRARVVFALVFPEDCGFRGTGIGGHSGDVQEISVEAEFVEGAWKAVSVHVPWHAPVLPKSWPLRLYVSAGKHHIYPAKANCDWGKFLFFDKCGGGKVEIPTLRLQDNVGERQAPLITSLAYLATGKWAEGYAGERAWGKSAWGDDWFCGGDPTRGGANTRWGRFKAFFGLSPCADGLDGKWDHDPAYSSELK